MLQAINNPEKSKNTAFHAFFLLTPGVRVEGIRTPQKKRPPVREYRRAFSTAQRLKG